MKSPLPWFRKEGFPRRTFLINLFGCEGAFKVDKEGPYLGFHQTLQPEDQRKKLYVAPIRKVGERVSKSKAYGRWKRAFERNT